MLKSRYEIGTHRDIYYFDCEDCAFQFYEQMKEKTKKVWLKDTHKNILLANTFGWKNGDDNDER